VKGVGSISNAILRGGLRLRGGTVVIVSSLEEVAAAKRLVVEEDVDVVTHEDEVAGENADVTASDAAMTAAV
jgi:hypothetical protein